MKDKQKPHLYGWGYDLNKSGFIFTQNFFYASLYECIVSYSSER